MQAGTLKFFDPNKGYGFITPDDGGKDVFVHETAVFRAGIVKLVEGDPIFFTTATRQGQDGKTFADLLSLTNPAN